MQFILQQLFTEGKQSRDTMTKIWVLFSSPERLRYINNHQRQTNQVTNMVGVYYKQNKYRVLGDCEPVRALYQVLRMGSLKRRLPRGVPSKLTLEE